MDTAGQPSKPSPLPSSPPPTTQAWKGSRFLPKDEGTLLFKGPYPSFLQLH